MELLGLAAVIAVLFLVYREYIKSRANKRAKSELESLLKNSISIKYESGRREADSPEVKSKADVLIQKFVSDLNYWGEVCKSPNEKFFVHYGTNLGEEEYGYQNGQSVTCKFLEIKNSKVALITELFFERPDRVVINDEGFFVVREMFNDYDKANELHGFDPTGQLLSKRKWVASIGEISLDPNTPIVAFETFKSGSSDSEQIILFDIAADKEITRFNKPFWCDELKLVPAKSMIVVSNRRFGEMKFDFSGTRLNEDEYIRSLIVKGKITEAVWFHEKEFDDELLFENENYVNLLLEGSNNPDFLMNYGEDKLHRRLGEFYEFQGDFEKTLAHWEKALALNPKVGVKRRFDSIRKKLNP